MVFLHTLYENLQRQITYELLYYTTNTVAGGVLYHDWHLINLKIQPQRAFGGTRRKLWNMRPPSEQSKTEIFDEAL